MSDRGSVVLDEVCAKCGQVGPPVPIVYGYPTAESFARAEAGEFRLGGCVISGGDPLFACSRCGEPFDHLAHRVDRVAKE